MMQNQNTTESYKGKHLCHDERKEIERWKNRKQPLSNREIARRLNRAPQTIHSEVKVGTVRQIRRQKQNGKIYEYAEECYSADAGQSAYENARKNCGRQYKWIHAPEFLEYADERMLGASKWSPDAVVGFAEKHQLFKEEAIPCTSTLYNWIDKGFLKTINLDLLLKIRRNTKKSKVRENKKVLGTSIETRPESINTRKTFGHWEIDTVIGLKSGGDAVLLTLAERKTRFEFIIKIERKAVAPVNQALREVQNQLGPNFEQLFQSITSDNGSEFYGLTELLNDRVPVYFAHPYSSWERGTNERQNGMIRRFIPKGTEMRHVSELTVKRVQQWMNGLPRKILGYATPYEAFIEEMSFLELVASTI